MKCVVPACPNRMTSRILNREPKRFFSFPEDPDTVKVWLAALRQSDKQEVGEQPLMICEDHFLPDDITRKGVKKDAIPIMPPYLEAEPGLMGGAWGAEEEDETQAEVAEKHEGVGEEPEEVPGPESPAAVASASASAVTASTITASAAAVAASAVTAESSVVSAESLLHQSVTSPSKEESVAALTRRLLELLMAAPDGCLDLLQVSSRLDTPRRTICDIISVLDALNVVQREAGHGIRWTAQTPVSSVVLVSVQSFQEELERLKGMEETLDTLIKDCAQQLFSMTDDPPSASAAYVTLEDLRGLKVLQDQTVILVKAPEETKLEIPAPQEDRVQIHLKTTKAPILVQTCEVEPEENPTHSRGGFFSTLEQSRIGTNTLINEW